jgi:hypothetical protein
MEAAPTTKRIHRFQAKPEDEGLLPPYGIKKSLAARNKIDIHFFARHR